MRPKHTAILITSLTGAAIAALSIVSLLVIMPPLRNLIWYGERIIRDDNRTHLTLVQERTQRKKELQQVTALILKRDAQYQSLQHEMDPLKAKNQKLKADNVDLLAHRNALQKRVSEIAASVSQKEARLLALNIEKRKLETWNLKAGEENRDLGKQNIDLAERNIRLSRTNSELTQTNTDLQADKVKLQAAKADLQRSYTAVDSAYHKLLEANEGETERVNTEKAELRREILALISERDDLAHQKDDLYGQIAGANRDFVQAYLSLREGKLNVRAGGELARLTIDSHQRPEKVHAELVVLMDRAAQIARKLGAGQGGGGREVAIVNKRVVTAADIQNADEEASLAALTDNIAASDTSVVIVARAVHNSVEGERVLIELTPRNVMQIFKKGDEIASCTLDSRDSVDRIVAQILQFLQKDVRDAAMRRGSIPRIDPETGAPEVGIENYGDLFTLTERVRKAGGMVKVDARAAAATTCADPLSLEFRVERTLSPR